MRSQLKAKLAAVYAAGRALVNDSPSALMLTLAVVLTGCSQPVTLGKSTQPADPNVATPAINYRPTIGTYTALRPSGAAGWSGQNERAAPKPESSQ